MKKYEYTLHANKKFKIPYVKSLEITKTKVQDVIEKPLALDKSEDPVYIAIGRLNDELSLCVAYRRLEERVKIITFYPAEKGRYERKILPGR